jgi:hypothetical protein
MVQVGRLQQHLTKVGQSRFVTATQLKCRVWTTSGVKKKVVSEVLRKYGVCVCVCVWSKLMFLTPPLQGTTPQILKLKFPVHTSGPKQKRK